MRAPVGGGGKKKESFEFNRPLEGDTLVVDCDELHVIERCAPINQDALHYEETIEDPKVFSRPWKMSMRLSRRFEKAQLLEFKCVEFAEELMYGPLCKQPSQVKDNDKGQDNEMKHRSLASTAALTFTVAVAFLALAPVAGQSQPAPPKKWTQPRTSDGQPDLQGIWSNATITPFERPKELAGKEFFTEQEAADYEKRILREGNRDIRGRNAAADVNGAYNEFWFDRGTKVVPTRRTSLLVDPPDGRVPPLTPEAQKAAVVRDEITRRPPEGPEDLALVVRCIVWPVVVPMLPTAYNNNYQILQTPGYVTLLTEMIHDVRIIPLDGRPHIPENIRLWLGDSRGRWEGKTLVVDTTNFNDKTHFRNSDRNLHLIERFTRTDANTILYQFTVEDPTAFTRPWKGEVPLTKAPGPIYEYACHEGNYAMKDILKGARAQEKEAAAGAKKDSR